MRFTGALYLALSWVSTISSLPIHETRVTTIGITSIHDQLSIDININRLLQADDGRRRLTDEATGFVSTLRDLTTCGTSADTLL